MNDIVSLLREQIALLAATSGHAMPTPAPTLAPGADGSRAVLPPAERPTDAGSSDAADAGAGEPSRTNAPPADGAASAGHAAADHVRAVLLREIGRISGFQPEQIRDDQSLVRDLGFDSMLFAELMAGVGTHFPGLGGWPAGAPRHPSVRDAGDVLVALVTGEDGAPAAAPSTAPPVAPAPVLAPVPPVSSPVPAANVPVLTPERSMETWSSLAEHDADLAAVGRNPYFLPHGGTARDTTTIDGRELICFSSYNYVGLSGDPRVIAGATDAIARYGTSVSASRFLSGERPVHRELETALAELIGTEDSVVMVSGHATNVSVIGKILGPDDLVVHDELAHDSILQGCALSGATRRPFPHNDPAALDALLTRLRHRHRRLLVVTEGVFSMDGDLADLPALIEIKDRHGGALMVDEAHSIGTIGRTGAGVREYFDVPAGSVELWSGTLSKSLAGCGGYVAGTRRIVDYLKYSTPGFVYSVGMTPGNAGASLAAIRVLREEPERLERLRRNSAEFLARAKAAGLDTGVSKDSAVVPVIVGSSQICLALANELFDQGISVNPILYPAVPDEAARLRFFITSEHTGDQLAHTVTVLADTLTRLRRTAGGHPAAVADPALAS